MSTGLLRPKSSSATPDKAAALDAVLGARVFVEVQIPRTEIAGKMRLVSHAEGMGLLAEARAAFAKLELPLELGEPGLVNAWNVEIAVRHLAIAVRDPSNTDDALAPLDEWKLCDEDQVSALWQDYQDLRERIDPLRNLAALTPAEMTAMIAAAKKKPQEVDLLMSYGSRKLALFAITLAEPPAS